MSAPGKPYRYPGVQPFSTAQQHLFFGREDDIKRLLSLLLQERLCVLFGKSGHGKSSLLNAGIIPALDERSVRGRRRYVPVPVRFNIWTPQDNQTLFDKFLFHLDKAMREAGVPLAADRPNLPPTLWGAFKHRAPDPDVGFVLLFDQFEEFFSFPPDQQAAFKEQLAELLYTDYPQYLEEYEDQLTSGQAAFLAEKIDARALFSIRSDRLSQLDRLKDRLPAILHKRYELRALASAQALEAITRPAAEGAGLEDRGLALFQSPAFTFEAEALQIMLQELSGRAGVETGRVEAFLLQIVCSSIEKRVSDHRLGTVTQADLPDFTTVFEDYYQLRIDELPEAERAPARRVLEQGLLLVDAQTGEARRLSRDAGELAQAFEVTAGLLQNLERTYLVRREINTLGGNSYEISHDTLIPPILKARKTQEAAEAAARLERERIESDRRTREAEEKAAEEKRRAEEAERLKKSAEAGRRRARFWALAASVIAALTLASLAYAWQQQQIALTKRLEAEENARQLALALEQTRAAEEARQRAEAEKAWKEVEDILIRAQKLEGSAPNLARGLKAEAIGILDRYPDNPLLQERRKAIDQ